MAPVSDHDPHISQSCTSSDKTAQRPPPQPKRTYLARVCYSTAPIHGIRRSKMTYILAHFAASIKIKLFLLAFS